MGVVGKLMMELDVDIYIHTHIHKRRDVMMWRIMWPVNWLRSKWINRHVPSAHAQIEELGRYILEEIPGEPSQNEGAIETAIRLLRERM